MTGITANVDVCAEQRKGCAHVMVEIPQVPCHRVVAAVTLRREIAPVWVALAMAIYAISGRIGKAVRKVAGLAIGRLVIAEQREAGQVVIEEDPVVPDLFVMTVCALDTLRSLVRIVVRVAVIAATLRRYLENWFNMAGGAFHRFVRTV